MVSGYARRHCANAACAVACACGKGSVQWQEGCTTRVWCAGVWCGGSTSGLRSASGAARNANDGGGITHELANHPNACACGEVVRVPVCGARYALKSARRSRRYVQCCAVF